MDKIQRYNRKDYSQFIDFPVEIVGKDGLIRRYSFDQSVKLYQQRISSAPLRYDNKEVVVAEIAHCSKRIDQLRRSYFARYGWDSYRYSGKPPKRLTMELAGEIAAFLRTFFGAGIRMSHVSLDTLSEEKNCSVFGMSFEGSKASFLLYVHTDKAAFKSFFVMHQVSVTQANSDKILAFHASNNVWLSVTGTESLPSLALDELAGRDLILEDALAAVQKGSLNEAVARFVIAYEENPYRRGAYWGAAIVAEQLRSYGDSEMALQMGVRYFPNDAGLQLRLAAALLRRFDADAKPHILQSISLGGDSIFTDYMLAIALLQEGRIISAQRKIKNLLPRLKSHPGILLSANWLLMQVRARGIIRFIGLMVLFFSGLGIGMGWWPMIIPAVLGALVIPMAHRSWKRQFKLTLLGRSGRHFDILPSTDLSQVNHLVQSPQ